MKRSLIAYIQWQIGHPKTVLAFLFMITLVFAGISTGLQFDFTIENLFPENDPEVDAYFEFREEFEREDDLISLAYDAGDPFSHENLLSTRMLTEAFSNIEGISEVTSLTNVELFEPGEDLVMAAVYKTLPVDVIS